MSEIMDWSDLPKRLGDYRDEGMSPGETMCRECGYKDFLILFVTPEQVKKDPTAPVEMECNGCHKRAEHTFFLLEGDELPPMPQHCRRKP